MQWNGPEHLSEYDDIDYRFVGHFCYIINMHARYQALYHISIAPISFADIAVSKATQSYARTSQQQFFSNELAHKGRKRRNSGCVRSKRCQESFAIDIVVEPTLARIYSTYRLCRDATTCHFFLWKCILCWPLHPHKMYEMHL